MCEIKKTIENITRPDLCYILGISKMIFEKNLNQQFTNIKNRQKSIVKFFSLHISHLILFKNLNKTF